MKTIASLLVLCGLYIFSSPLLAHGHDDDASVERYAALYDEMNRLSQRAVLSGADSTKANVLELSLPSGESLRLDQDVISQWVHHAVTLVWETHGSHDPKELERLLLQFEDKEIFMKWFQQRWGGLIGWIYDKKRERGIDWVIATVVFEVVEHTILFMVPPGFAACEVFQFTYLMTSGAGWRAYGLATNNTLETSYWERTKRTFSIPYFHWFFRQRTNFFKDEILGIDISYRDYKKSLKSEVKKLETALAKSKGWLKAYRIHTETAEKETNFVMTIERNKYLQAYFEQTKEALEELASLSEKDDLYSQWVRDFQSASSNTEQLASTIHDIEHLIEARMGKVKWEQQLAKKREFWKEVYSSTRGDQHTSEEAQVTHPFTKGLEALFNTADPIHRFTLAKRQIAWVQLQREILTQVVYEAFEHGQINRLEYYEIRDSLGLLGKAIRWDYTSSLFAIAMHSNPREAANKTRALKQLGLVGGRFIDLFTQASSLISSPNGRQILKDKTTLLLSDIKALQQGRDTFTRDSCTESIIEQFESATTADQAA